MKILNKVLCASLLLVMGLRAEAKGSQFTLGELFNRINTNNPSRTSNFLVPLKGQQVIIDAQCWSVLPDGSASAQNVGITTAWVNQNSSMVVNLNRDDVLLNYLCQQNRVAQNDKARYGQILVYFTIKAPDGKIYRLYLNDPFPGTIKKIAGKEVNPVAMILKKINLSDY